MKKQQHLSPSTEYTIAIIHGWGMNSGIFDEFKTLLIDACKQAQFDSIKVITLDLPGYGDFYDDDVSDLNLAELAQILEQRLGENTILIAWSLGGLIAQALAIGASKKLIGLICMCSSPKFVSEKDWYGIEPLVLQTFQKQLTSDHIRTLKRFLAIQNMGQPSAKTQIAKMLESIQAKPLAHTRTLKHGLRILQESDIRHTLHAISIPTLRLYGKLDSLVPHKSSGRIEDLHKSSHSKVYSKASHAPFLSHPDEVVMDILNFMSTEIFSKDL